MIKKLLSFFKQKSDSIPEKFPYEIYEDFINSGKSFEDLNYTNQNIIINYIGVQCSPMVSNDYNIRVTLEDVIKHVHKEIDIFVLQKHLANPTENSPKEIYLGNHLWKLKDLKYEL